ncbi:hypothetical protein GGI07_001584 [Coemansia sp. Benny D115]|nr:hypothetical protein GGI07_001584 [Coemansia sp. Benny D115]
MGYQLEADVYPTSGQPESRALSDEPLLLRMDLATHAFYRSLESASDKKLMEIASRVANVSVLLRPATKKELKRYQKPGEEETTRDIVIKYRSFEDNLLRSGTFDILWGLRWLLSFEILIETPLTGIAEPERMPVVVELWLEALVAAGIHEVADQMDAARAVLRTAREELPLLRALSERLPGEFNRACSMAFEGQMHDAFVDMYKPKWVLADQAASARRAAAEGEHGQLGVAPVGLMHGYFSGIVPSDAACVRSRPVDLRVRSMQSAASAGDTAEQFQGILVQASIFDRSILADKEDEEPVVLRFEQGMAEYVRPGFVIEATLHTLSNGVHYIDAVTMVWPSFTPLDYIEGY